MRSNLGFIHRRIGLHLQPGTSRRGPATPVTLQWTVRTGGTQNPVTKQITGGTSETFTRTVNAFVHFAEAKTIERQYAEIETGDAIVDFAGDVALDGKSDLRFLIDGQVYVQAKTASKLTRMWDAVAQGQRLCRTVLLRKAT